MSELKVVYPKSKMDELKVYFLKNKFQELEKWIHRSFSPEILRVKDVTDLSEDNDYVEITVEYSSPYWLVQLGKTMEMVNLLY